MWRNPPLCSKLIFIAMQVLYTKPEGNDNADTPNYIDWGTLILIPPYTRQVELLSLQSMFPPKPFD